MITNKDIYNFIDTFAPFNTQCSWDNSGFIVGNFDAETKRVAFALDATSEALKAAEQFGATLLITHHPAIFRSTKKILSDYIIFKAIRSGIALLGVHTPFDCADGGVNDVLAGLLELENVEKLPSDDFIVPMARIGIVKKTSAAEFAKKVAQNLNTTVRLLDCGKPVQNVAVCGGSAMEIAFDALKCGADTFVTGDAKHHELLEAREAGINIIAAGHYETENPSVEILCKRVKYKFPQLDCLLIKGENPVEFVS